MRGSPLLSWHFSRWWNQGPERLINLLKVTPQSGYRAMLLTVVLYCFQQQERMRPAQRKSRVRKGGCLGPTSCRVCGLCHLWIFQSYKWIYSPGCLSLATGRILTNTETTPGGAGNFREATGYILGVCNYWLQREIKLFILKLKNHLDFQSIK